MTVALLAVAGCDDRVLDSGLTFGYMAAAVTGDQPASAAVAPSPIRRMSGSNPDYPNLATVPMRPAPPLTDAERQQAAERLAADRAAGRLASEQLELSAPPPLPIPPSSAGNGLSGKKKR